MGPEPASWVEFCVVSFSLPAAEMAPDRLACVTSPSSPLLLMRTGALVFCAQHCVEFADESAVWSLDAFCLTSCTTGLPPPPHVPQPPSDGLPHLSLQPSLSGNCLTSGPPASCVAVWFVSFLFTAADSANEPLIWVTEPPSPGEPMRTG